MYVFLSVYHSVSLTSVPHMKELISINLCYIDKYKNTSSPFNYNSLVHFTCRSDLNLCYLDCTYLIKMAAPSIFSTLH